MSDAVTFAGAKIGVWQILGPVPDEDKPRTDAGGFWWALCENCHAYTALRAVKLAQIVRGKRRPWRCIECKAM